MKLVFAVALLCAPFMAQAADKAVADPDKKICRSQEVTGSLFPKRVCHTKSEWAAVESDQERSAEQLQARSRGNGVDVPH
jgi:hypothetical protein